MTDDMPAGALPVARELTAEAIPRVLESLDALGAGAWDPVRYRFITALWSRTGGLPEAALGMVRRRLVALLGAYLEDLAAARGEARELAQTVGARGDAWAEAARDCLVRWDYHALRRLARRSDRSSGPLSALTGTLGEGAAEETAETRSLAASLNRQERELLREYQFGVEPEELRSSRRFRHAMLRRTTRDLVAAAVDDTPEDAGPLNPQRLAVQSLARMQALSPAYTACLVSYVDAVFTAGSLPRK